MSEGPKDEIEPEAVSLKKEDLISQLEAHVEYFERLPDYQRFQYATNTDLHYFMLIILNIFKRI